MGEAAMRNAYFICHNVQVKINWQYSKSLIFIALRTLCGFEDWGTELQRRRSAGRRCSQSSSPVWLPDKVFSTRVCDVVQIQINIYTYYYCMPTCCENTVVWAMSTGLNEHSNGSILPGSTGSTGHIPSDVTCRVSANQRPALPAVDQSERGLGPASLSLTRAGPALSVASNWCRGAEAERRVERRLASTVTSEWL